MTADFVATLDQRRVILSGALLHAALALGIGDPNEAERQLRRSIAAYRSAGDERGVARAEKNKETDAFNRDVEAEERERIDRLAAEEARIRQEREEAERRTRERQEAEARRRREEQEERERIEREKREEEERIEQARLEAEATSATSTIAAADSPPSVAAFSRITIGPVPANSIRASQR